MSSNGRIIWTNEKRKLADLIPWEQNPRQLKKDQAERLSESLDEFGQVETIAVEPDNEVINGHQRLNVLRQQYDPDYEIDVRVASRKLTLDERKKLTIYLHEGATGEWNFDILPNLFEVDELLEWGFPEWRLNIMPSNDAWGEAFTGLPDSDRAPFQQMTFTLHDSQVEQVREAITISKSLSDFNGSPNENSNGNALARVCELFIAEHGRS